MRLFFPNLNQNKVFYKSNLRIINKINLKKKDLQPSEFVISIDYENKITLCGYPSTETTILNGYLFEELYKLPINLNINSDLTSFERETILKFVSLYSQPKTLLGQEIFPIYRRDLNNSFFEEGDKINWLFFPYSSKPQDKNQLDYFYSFRNMLRDFKETVDLVKNKKNFKPGGLTEVFNNFLAGNVLYLNPDYSDYYSDSFKGHYLSFVSKTSLSLCYLELYSIILSHSNIRLCKYCNELFTTEKNNVVRCKRCREDQNLFRKIYYEKNKEKEREEAKKRMRKHRKKKKSLQYKI